MGIVLFGKETAFVPSESAIQQEHVILGVVNHAGPRSRGCHMYLVTLTYILVITNSNSNHGRTLRQSS